MTEGKKKPAKPKKPAVKKPATAKNSPNKGTAPAEAVKKLQDEVKSLNEKVLRAMAEAENTRRRAQREVEDTRAYSITAFAREMLTVQDNLRRALKHLPEDMKNNDGYKAFVEGVEMTERELLNIFDRHGIREVSPKGEAFDHNLHQAMFEVETADAEPGTIVQVIQEGYVIKDRLLRPAMVGVAKAPAEKKPDEEKPAPEEEAPKE